MEQADAALRGQDDMFELEEAGALKGKRSGAGYDDSSDEEGDSAEEEENDQVLDPEEERERKVAGLEGELDGLYDAYQEHLKERDAKHRVKEVRKNSKVGEEWHGIGKGDDLDSSDAEEGGYERVQRAKARIGENDSSDDDISDEEAIAESSRMVGKKRRQGNGPAESSSKNKKSRTVVEPEGPKTTASLSRSAQLWFDQNIFVGAHEDIEDDEEDVDKDGGDEDEAEADEDMEMSEENEEDGDEEASFEVKLGSMLPNATHHRLDGVTTTSKLYPKIRMMMSRCGTSTARTRTKSSRRRYEVRSYHYFTLPIDH